VHFEGETRYYLRFPILDRPGLIGKIATVLGDHGISITHAMARLDGGLGNVMIVTHETSESEVCRALVEIADAGVLGGEPLSLRILE
jgi:homoserine dehydrogenase